MENIVFLFIIIIKICKGYIIYIYYNKYIIINKEKKYLIII